MIRNTLVISKASLNKLILEFEKYDQWATYIDSENPEITVHPWMSPYKLKDQYFNTWNTFFFGIDLKTRKTSIKSPNSSDIDSLLEDEGIYIEEIDYSNIWIDDIIETFYSTLMTEEIYIDYGFPHESNLRVSVVKNEEIIDLINPSKSDSDQNKRVWEKEYESSTLIHLV